jgi:transcriptional regulator with XRE-family HTH domain
MSRTKCKARTALAAEINPVVGHNIRIARDALNMSTRHLCEALGTVDRAYIRGVETGLRPVSLTRLVQFARELCVPPGALLEGL